MIQSNLSARIILVLGAVVWLLPLSALAQEPFFRGKAVRIVVGLAAGGGFET